MELVLAFVLSLGFQLKHQTTCRGGGCLTRHSHYVRVRLGGVTIWRLQCTTCRAVFTVLPHFVLRYRQMRPEVACNALLATHGGLSLEWCAVPYQRRAQHAGQCGVEVEGGRVPTPDWMLNLQILTSGGFRRVGTHSTTKLGGMWHIQRWQLGTSYPVIVADVQALLTSPRLAGQHTLLVDHTGCGRPVVDMLRQAGLVLLAVSIHGGDTVSHAGMDYRTPKRDLVSTVQVLLQQGRLQIAEALPLTPILTSELQAFRVKIDPLTAHDSYSAWRERDHDDVVLALALACWWGEYRQRRRAGVWGA